MGKGKIIVTVIFNCMECPYAEHNESGDFNYCFETGDKIENLNDILESCPLTDE